MKRRMAISDFKFWISDLMSSVFSVPLCRCMRFHVDGKLSTRTWARGITASYGYDNSGSLISVSYSDNTPSISYTHNRHGQGLSAVTDGVSTHLFACSAYGQRTNETIIANGEATYLARGYDSLGRSSRISPGTGYAVSYAYDPLDRIPPGRDGPPIPYTP